LFGDKSEKAAREAAAQAEKERLVGLPPPELAAEIMPASGPDGMGTKGGHRQGPVEVCSWLMSSFSQSSKCRQPLLRPVLDGLQMLGHAGLVQRHTFGGSGTASTYAITALGRTALADGSARQRLIRDAS
jgi:hypothetical protein